MSLGDAGPGAERDTCSLAFLFWASCVCVCFYFEVFLFFFLSLLSYVFTEYRSLVSLSCVYSVLEIQGAGMWLREEFRGRTDVAQLDLPWAGYLCCHWHYKDG